MTPTPDEMVEELEGAARDLRACANKKKDAVESLTGFSLDAIAIYTGNAADLIQQQLATIERLSAALEEARTVLIAQGFGPHTVTIRTIDAALRKDAK